MKKAFSKSAKKIHFNHSSEIASNDSKKEARLKKGFELGNISVPGGRNSVES